MKQRCPPKAVPSPFVEEALQHLQAPKDGMALDIPCGYGRHTRLLTERGHHVTAADIDARCVRATLDSVDITQRGRIQGVILDATRNLPFKPNSIAVAVVVDYVHRGLLARLAEYVCPGGHLVFQTFGARGENWRELPKTTALAHELSPVWRKIRYNESPVRPESERRVTVKAVLQRTADVAGLQQNVYAPP